MVDIQLGSKYASKNGNTFYVDDFPFDYIQNIVK